MIPAENIAIDDPEGSTLPEPRHMRAVPQPPVERSIPDKPRSGILGRLIFFYIGLSFVMLGWPLAVSAVGAFIGIPLIIFGLALMQAQERE